MFRFAIATLSPALLILAACLWGGGWSLGALIWMTSVVTLGDRLRPVRGVPETDGRSLSVLLALVHLLLLALTVRTLAQDGVEWGGVATFWAMALWLGQVSNANAHELIHARDRTGRRIGIALFSSLLHGHHASAHLHVHHVHAATALDPNSAPKGMGFYRFLPRAMAGELIAAWRVEARRAHGLRHPFIAYTVISAGCVICAYALGGLTVYLGLCLAAQVQLFLSDYVQHYGLRRGRDARGRREPMGLAHSWNAAAPVSGAMMLNATRHSDHHTNPARSYPTLRLDPQMPMLPHSLPMMAVCALIPPLWRRKMDPRLRAWHQKSRRAGQPGKLLSHSPHAPDRPCPQPFLRPAPHGGGADERAGI